MIANTIIQVETIDGRHVFAEMPTSPAGSDDSAVDASFKRFMRQSDITLDIDGEVVVIPMRTIKTFRITPSRQ